MKYKPEYAKGQILVLFNEGYRLEFLQDFWKTLGYPLSDERYLHGDFLIFQTKEGKEQEARKKFESYPEFVEFTELRDIKIESRWNSLEELVTKIEDMTEDVEIPDEIYNKKLDEVISYLNNLKSK